MSDMTYIYSLIDPDTGSVRYVGKSDDPHNRYQRHLCPSQLRAKTHKNAWIKSLLKQGKRPGLAILMCCEKCVWPMFEMGFIAMHRIRQTQDVLTNGSDGGDGQSKGWSPSEKARRNMSQAQMGNTKGRGEKNHNAKLTEAKVIELRKLYATGKYTQVELGKQFGLTQGAVGHIIRRKNWKHLS